MFKRLFILSGIIAFILAGLTMWFWYLPNQEPINNTGQKELNQEQQEAVEVDTTMTD